MHACIPCTVKSRLCLTGTFPAAGSILPDHHDHDHDHSNPRDAAIGLMHEFAALPTQAQHMRTVMRCRAKRNVPHHAACQGSCLVKADNTDISGSLELAGIEHVDSFQPELLCARPQCTNDDC